MKWKRNTGFDEIEDRRGQGPTGGGLGDVFGTGGGGGGIPIPIPGGKGGLGLGGIVIFVVLFLLTSGILGGGSSLGGLDTGAAQPGGTLDPQGDTDQQLALHRQRRPDLLGRVFKASGKTYH